MSVIFDSVTAVLNDVLAFIPNPEEKAKAQFAAQQQLISLFADSDKAQDAINQQEAASSNIFESGWRPFVGWVCGLSYAWNHLGVQFFTWFISVCGYVAPALPTIVDDNTILLGMLGLGAMRSFEKYNGVTK